MAFWNPNQYTPVNYGVTVNDGTGDVIRNAFIKVDNNFANISSQLSTTQQDFLNANIQIQLNTNYLTANNSFIANSVSGNSAVTGNITANNIVANLTLTCQGETYFNSNVYLTGNIVPTINGQFDIGSPTNRIGNIWAVGQQIQNSITTNVDAGLLVLHQYSNIGDSQDVGIFGNVSSDFGGANTYAFFGRQLSTDAFTYLITNVDTTQGNNIVTNGTRGSAIFGNMLLSNTMPSTSTSTGALVVAGGAGIAGNLNVGGNTNVTGNILSGGFQVLTTNTPGLTQYSGSVSAFNTVLTLTSATASTSTGTGALVIPFGGAGIVGNVTAGALVGPYYGTIQTAAQPNITSLGTLMGGLQIGSGQLSTPSIVVTGSGVLGAPLTVSAGGANITGNLFSIGTVTSTGNATVANVLAGGFYWANGAPFLSSSYGNANVAVYLPFDTTITGIQANLGAYQIWANANATSQQNQITGANTNIQTISANLGAYQTWANTTIQTTNANLGAYQTWANTTIQTTNANLGAYQTWANANVSSLQNQITGANTNIQTLNANVGAYQIWANANATSQQNQITGANTNIQTISANLGAYQTYANAAAYGNANVAAYLPTYTGNLAAGNVMVAYNILPTGSNATSNIGSSTAWFNTFFGVSTQAKYADLAERYTADANYEPGTVVVFGGSAEITTSTEFADTRVAGAISTEPAYLMNAAEIGIPVALRGRVPVKVEGPVTKGDCLVTSGKHHGHAVSVGSDGSYGPAIFAKALETDLDPEVKTITAVIL